MVGLGQQGKWESGMRAESQRKLNYVLYIGVMRVYLHCFPIAPADERIDGFPCGIGLESFFAPSESAAAVVLDVMSDVVEAEFNPSCSFNGPVDLGITLVDELFTILECLGATRSLCITLCGK